MSEKQEFELKAIVPNSLNSDFYTVYLLSEDNIILPIQTNRWASESLLVAKQQLETPRPHIHNTYIRSLNALGAEVKECLIYKYLDEVFYCYLLVKFKNKKFELDIKMTDGLCIALWKSLKIYALPEVYKKAGIKITRDLIEGSMKL